MIRLVLHAVSHPLPQSPVFLKVTLVQWECLTGPCDPDAKLLGVKAALSCRAAWCDVPRTKNNTASSSNNKTFTAFQTSCTRTFTHVWMGFFFCLVGCFCFYLLNYVVAEERIQNARNRSAAFKNISTRSHDYSHNERDNQIKSGLIPFAPRTEISPLITLASIASSVRPINPLASAGVSAIAQQPTRWRWKIQQEEEEGCFSRLSGFVSPSLLDIITRHPSIPLPSSPTVVRLRYIVAPHPSSSSLLLLNLPDCWRLAAVDAAVLSRSCTGTRWLNEKDMLAFVLVSGSLWIILGEFIFVLSSPSRLFIIWGFCMAGLWLEAMHLSLCRGWGASRCHSLPAFFRTPVFWCFIPPRSVELLHRAVCCSWRFTCTKMTPVTSLNSPPRTRVSYRASIQTRNTPLRNSCALGLPFFFPPGLISLKDASVSSPSTRCCGVDRAAHAGRSMWLIFCTSFILFHCVKVRFAQRSRCSDKRTVPPPCEPNRTEKRVVFRPTSC